MYGPTRLPDSRRSCSRRREGQRHYARDSDVRTNRHDEILTTDESLPSGVDPQVAATLQAFARRTAVAMKGPRGLQIYSIDGGAARLIPGAYADYTSIGWAADSRALHLYRSGDVPASSAGWK